MEQIINFVKKTELPKQNLDFHDVIIISVDNRILSSAPAYIGSLLLKLNYNPKIIQNIDHMRYDQFKPLLDKYFVNENQILAVSLTFCRSPWQKRKIADFIKFVREKLPKIKIVVGGANNAFDFKILPKDTIRMMGQNREDEILKLFASFKGVEWTEKFDFTKFKIEYKKLFGLNHPKGMTMYLELSRGCIFNCAFCNYALRKSKSSFKLADQIKQEIEEFYEVFKSAEVVITCNTFNDDVDKMYEVIKAVEQLPFTPSFFAYTRLDLFATQIEDEKIANFFRDYIRYPFFGIEGVTSTSLKLIGKQANVEKTKATLLKIKKLMPDAIITTSFIIGLPGQTYEDEINYFSWMEENDVSHFTSIIPLNINEDPTEDNKEQSTFDLNPEKYGIEKITDKSIVDEIFRTRQNKLDELNLKSGDLRDMYHPWKYINTNFTYIDAFISAAQIDKYVKIRRSLQRSRYMFLRARGINLPKTKEVSFFNKGLFYPSDDIKVHSHETLYLNPEQEKFSDEYLEYLAQ